MQPDYKKIYSDILKFKFPHKKEACKPLLEKENLSAIDVIELNKIIFGATDKNTLTFNQKHRSYHKADILKILNFQKKNHLNNVQLANHYKISRNTIAKWKNHFLV